MTSAIAYANVTESDKTNDSFDFQSSFLLVSVLH